MANSTTNEQALRDLCYIHNYYFRNTNHRNNADAEKILKNYKKGLYDSTEYIKDFKILNEVIEIGKDFNEILKADNQKKLQDGEITREQYIQKINEGDFFYKCRRKGSIDGLPNNNASDSNTIKEVHRLINRTVGKVFKINKGGVEEVVKFEFNSDHNKINENKGLFEECLECLESSKPILFSYENMIKLNVRKSRDGKFIEYRKIETEDPTDKKNYHSAMNNCCDYVLKRMRQVVQEAIINRDPALKETKDELDKLEERVEKLEKYRDIELPQILKDLDKKYATKTELNKLRKDLTKELEKLNTEDKKLQSQIDELKEQIKNATNSETIIKIVEGQIQKIVTDEIDKCSKRIEQIEQKLTDHENKINQNTKGINDLEKKIGQIGDEQIKPLQDKVKSLEDQIKQQEQIKSNFEKQSNDILLIKSSLSNLDDIFEKKGSVDELKSELEEWKKGIENKLGEQNEQITKQLNEFYTKIEAMVKDGGDITKIKKQITDYEKQITDYKKDIDEKISGLHNRITINAKNIDNLNGEIGQIKEAINQLKNSLNKISKDLETTNDNIDKTRTELLGVVDEVANTLDAKDKDLQNQINDLKDQIKKATSAEAINGIIEKNFKEIIENRIIEYEDQIKGINGKVNQINTDLTEVKKTLGEHDQKINTNKKDIETLQGKVGDLETQEKETKNLVNSLENKILTNIEQNFLSKNDFQKKIEELKKDFEGKNDEFVKKLEELENSLKDIGNVVNNTIKNEYQNLINNTLDNYNKQLNQINTDLAEVKETLGEHDQRINKNKEDIETLQGKVGDLETQEKETKKLVNSLENKILTNIEQNFLSKNDFQKKIEDLKKDFKGKNDEFVKKLEKLEKSLEELGNVVNNTIKNEYQNLINNTLDNYNKQLSQINNDLTEAKLKIKNHERRITKNEYRTIQLQNEIKEEKEKIKKLEESLNSTDSEKRPEIIKQIEKENKSLIEKYKELSGSLEITQNNLLSLQGIVKNNSDNINQLRDALKKEEEKRKEEIERLENEINNKNNENSEQIESLKKDLLAEQKNLLMVQDSLEFIKNNISQNTTDINTIKDQINNNITVKINENSQQILNLQSDFNKLKEEQINQRLDIEKLRLNKADRSEIEELRESQRQLIKLYKEQAEELKKEKEARIKSEDKLNNKIEENKKTDKVDVETNTESENLENLENALSDFENKEVKKQHFGTMSTQTDSIDNNGQKPKGQIASFGSSQKKVSNSGKKNSSTNTDDKLNDKEKIEHLSNLYYLIGTSNEHEGATKEKTGVAVAYMLNARSVNGKGINGVVPTLNNLSENLANKIEKGELNTEQIVELGNFSNKEDLEKIINDYNTRTSSPKTKKEDNKEKLKDELYGYLDHEFIVKANNKYKDNHKDTKENQFLNNYYENCNDGRCYIQQVAVFNEKINTDLKPFINQDDIIDENKLEENHKKLDEVHDKIAIAEGKENKPLTKDKEANVEFSSSEQMENAKESMDHAERVNNQFNIEENEVKDIAKPNDKATLRVKYPDDYSQEYKDLIIKNDNYIDALFNQETKKLSELKNKDAITGVFGQMDDNEEIEVLIINGVEICIPAKYCDWVEINKGIGRDRGILPGILEYMKETILLNGGDIKNINNISNIITVNTKENERMTLAEANSKNKGKEVMGILMNELGAVEYISGKQVSKGVFKENDLELIEECCGVGKRVVNEQMRENSGEDITINR